MSSFYTNIQLAGDTILYRGYEDGEPVQYRSNFSPSLYVLSKNSKEECTTLDGRPVSPIQFQTAREAREFIKTYIKSKTLKSMVMKDLFINISVESFQTK